MTQATSQTNETGTPSIRGILWDIALNAIIPFILYRLSKRYISPSDLMALIVATTFPLGKSFFELLRHRQLDPVSIVVLLGILTSGAAILFGGSPKILLIRESLFTGVFGFACFASLLMPRPLMFYFGRYFVASQNPMMRERFDGSWRFALVRHTHRVITVVWGGAYLGEFIVRVILVFTLPSPAVLVISPLLIGAVTIAAILWTRTYVREFRARLQPLIAEASK